jgi:hypothetical protein
MLLLDAVYWILDARCWILEAGSYGFEMVLFCWHPADSWKELVVFPTLLAVFPTLLVVFSTLLAVFSTLLVDSLDCWHVRKVLPVMIFLE